MMQPGFQAILTSCTPDLYLMSSWLRSDTLPEVIGQLTDVVYDEFRKGVQDLHSFDPDGLLDQTVALLLEQAV